jgi:formylglycine-generating enzyme required for sulfatase activity
MCLRATDKNIPPASAIPYTLDASTKGRTQKVVEMLLADPAKQTPEPPGPKPGPVSGLTSFFIKAKSKWLMIVASLCVLLVVIIAAMILTSRKSSPSAAAQATQAQAKADADAKAHDEARLAAEKEKLAAESKAKVDADAASEQAKAKAEQDRLAAAQKAKADADAKVTEEAKQKAEQDRLIAEANAKAQAEAKASEEARQKAEKEQLAAEEKAKADTAARQQAEQERIVAEANAKALAEAKAAEEARVKAAQEQLAIQAKADADAKAKVAEEARLASERELAAAQAKAKAEADAKTLAQARIESDQTKLALVVKPAEAVPAAQAAQSTPGQNPAPGTGGGINLDNSAGIKFAWVAGMPDAKGPVAVGVYEITQGEYTDVMQTNPSQYHDGPATLPVESVTGDNAVQFCAKLTEREHTKHTLDSNWKYTLPTENQWRYFAKDTPIMDAVTSRFRPVSDLRGHPEPVGGSRKPNPLGLRDVVGNVSEWCYGVDGKLEAIGGAYDTRNPSLTAPALALDPASASNNVGFRIIVSPVAP